MVDDRNFNHLRRDSLIVGLAGITTNLILAIIFAGIFKLLYIYQYDFLNTYMGGVIAQMVYYIVQINIVLMIFNLLPVPPLDGFGIITQIFNLRQKDWYYQVYNNGFLILLLLIVFNVTDKVIGPAISFVSDFVMNIFF